MLKGLGDIGRMMQQAQELQAKMAEMQAKLETIEVEGVSGAGMVKATATAKGRIVNVSIDPSLMGSAGDEDRSVLEDLIVAAISDAQHKAQERAQQEMAALTEGLPIPPGFGMPM